MISSLIIFYSIQRDFKIESCDITRSGPIFSAKKQQLEKSIIHFGNVFFIYLKTKKI